MPWAEPGQVKIRVMTYDLWKLDDSSDDVSEMFPFKKKKKEKAVCVPPQQPVPKDVPKYRMNGHAVEYEGEKEEVETRDLSGADGVAASEPHRKGFQPLPRCSHCGTAISYDQKKCHACEEDLRGI